MTCIFGTSDGCSCYVCDSCQKDWDATRAERDRLREALRDALVLLENGDFANGVTHFGLDEGAMAARHMIERLRQALWEGEP